MPADGRWDLTRHLKGYYLETFCSCPRLLSYIPQTNAVNKKYGRPCTVWNVETKGEALNN